MNERIRRIEEDIAAAIRRCDAEGLLDAEVPRPGQGIIVAQGYGQRTFKIEITQVDGPQ